MQQNPRSNNFGPDYFRYENQDGPNSIWQSKADQHPALPHQNDESNCDQCGQ